MNTLLVSPAGAISTVVSAFRADPAARWFYPDSRDFEAHFPRFVEAFAGEAFVLGTACLAEGGAALWLPPGTGPDEEAMGTVVMESVPHARQGDVFALFEAMGECHPREPHWYLPMVGVEPDRQNSGLGSRLMREALARCDCEGLPAYLESTNPRNIPFYERFGFRRTGLIEVGGCPPIVPMCRKSQK